MAISYNPGIQDRSGEILGQGMARLGQGIGSGASKLLQYFMGKEQQAFNAMEKSREGALKAKEAAKKSASLFDAYSKIAVNQYGMDPNEVKPMSLDALTATIDKMDAAEKFKAGMEERKRKAAMFQTLEQAMGGGSQPASLSAAITPETRYSGGLAGAMGGPGGGSGGVPTRDQVLRAAIMNGVGNPESLLQYALQPKDPAAEARAAVDFATAQVDLQQKQKNLAKEDKKPLFTQEQIGVMQPIIGLPGYSSVPVTENSVQIIKPDGDGKLADPIEVRLFDAQREAAAEGDTEKAEYLSKILKKKLEGEQISPRDLAFLAAIRPELADKLAGGGSPSGRGNDPNDFLGGPGWGTGKPGGKSFKYNPMTGNVE